MMRIAVAATFRLFPVEACRYCLDLGATSSVPPEGTCVNLNLKHTSYITVFIYLSPGGLPLTLLSRNSLQNPTELPSSWGFRTLYHFKAVISVFARFPVRRVGSELQIGSSSQATSVTTAPPNGLKVAGTRTNHRMKAQVFTASVSKRLSAPLSDSFSLVMFSFHIMKGRLFTFSMHSAASSSGCLFKDNEASVCTLKCSVPHTVL